MIVERKSNHPGHKGLGYRATRGWVVSQFLLAGACIALYVTHIRGFVGGIRVGEFRTGVRMICSPSGVELLDAMRISLKWMNEHPDQLDHPAVELIFRALVDAFPCAKSSPRESPPPKPKEEKKKGDETVL